MLRLPGSSTHALSLSLSAKALPETTTLSCRVCRSTETRKSGLSRDSAPTALWLTKYVVARLRLLLASFATLGVFRLTLLILLRLWFLRLTGLECRLTKASTLAECTGWLACALTKNIVHWLLHKSK